MTLLDEISFTRLLAKYVRRFGEPPPISIGTLDEVMERMRRDLARAESQRIPGNKQTSRREPGKRYQAGAVPGRLKRGGINRPLGLRRPARISATCFSQRGRAHWASVRRLRQKMEEITMHITDPDRSFSIGDIVIDAKYDPAAQEYEGAVRNRPYAVKLHAVSLDGLEGKYERLFSRYLGFDA